MPPHAGTQASLHAQVASLATAFGMGALVGIPIGMIWSWIDYGAFELG